MVKRELKTSVSEEDGPSGILNENGKRVCDTQNKDGPKRIKTKSLYRQPTVQELNRLQETENLFNSNLFRLQIDEVLQEVKLKEKTENKFNEWFSQLKTYLLSIPSDDTEYDLTEKILTKKLKVKLPIPEALNKTKCMFKFQKFKDVEIVGSYSLGCVISSKLIVDIQITAPAETYTKNDSVNYRYHKKRAAYLAYIASHLSSTELIDELKYSTVNCCKTKPVLNLKPTGKLGNHLTVQIDVTCEQEAYKLHRFSPSRNNLRESWLFDTKENINEIGPSTPYYNSSVLSDLTATANQELLKNILSNSDNLKQAIVLLKIWLRQRDLKVSGYIVCLFVAYFVQIKRINNIMSSYQIVRNFWIALKSLELDKKGISLQKGDDSPSLDDFHQHFPIVFLDVTGYYNICWSMCKGTYEALKREAGLAVEMLDSAKINSFIALFMTPVKPLLQFDHILRFKDVKALKDSITSKAPKQSRLNYGLDTVALIVDTLHALLTKGLGKRAELVLQIVEADFSWSVKKKLEKVVGDHCIEKLSFGFVLNPEHATNPIEKGPPANLPEAELFRLFWGEKSELRRFQDGSITETVVWSGDTALQTRTVTTQILNYLIRTKYDISPKSLFHISHQFESLLMCPHKPGTEDTENVEELSTRVVTTFDELRRDLRGLVDLPLDVSACNGVSSVFSYSTPLPPSGTACPRGAWRRGGTCLIKDKRGPRDVPRYVPVSRAVMELGHSGKWPGDINAFRCLKAAFHLQIAQQLTKQYSLGTQAYPNHVDVIKNGLVYRLSIVHPKEVTLLRKEVENGVAKYRDTEDSLKLYREGFVVPRLRGAMHGLHQKFPSFGPTSSLFKRWLSSHLLSPPHVPSPLPEALCARVYLQCAPVTPPLVPTLGLVRVWQMLVATDWDTEVVVLDFNDDLSAEELSSIERSVSPRPPMCVIAATGAGGEPLPSPSAPVRGRLLALAAAALRYIHTELDACNDNLLAAFVPSLSGYDVLIHLDPSLVAPSKRPNVKGSIETDDEVIPVVDFNVVRKYLDELRSAYDEFALFFNDRYGGDVIAVLWKPDINDFKEFQSLNAHALTPIQDGGSTKYRVNIPAIIEDFKTMGAGLVKNVTVQ